MKKNQNLNPFIISFGVISLKRAPASTNCTLKYFFLVKHIDDSLISSKKECQKLIQAWKAFWYVTLLEIIQIFSYINKPMHNKNKDKSCP